MGAKVAGDPIIQERIMESKKEFIEAIHNHKIFIIEKGDHKRSIQDVR